MVVLLGEGLVRLEENSMGRGILGPVKSGFGMGTPQFLPSRQTAKLVWSGTTDYYSAGVMTMLR
jgi:hypothetical protein